MNQDNPFLIWTPPVYLSENPDRDIILMNCATDALDTLFETGTGADIILDCISEMGMEPGDYVANIERQLGI